MSLTDEQQTILTNAEADGWALMDTHNGVFALYKDNVYVWENNRVCVRAVLTDGVYGQHSSHFDMGEAINGTDGSVFCWSCATHGPNDVME